MTRPSRFAVAKDRLIADLDAVVPAVLGVHNARTRDRKRALWNVTNPWRAKAKASQMCVWMTGARRGAWTDFVSGDKGDAIDLVAFGLEGAVTADSRIRAVEWAEDRYGLRQLDPETRKKQAAEAEKRRAAAIAFEAEMAAGARERARKMFYGSVDTIAGTLAETYLATRGIVLADVPHLEPAFRFRPAFEYWLGAKRDPETGRKLQPGPEFPALVSAMVSADGTINACHITYLAPDGRDKAPVDKPKLVWPATRGFVVRVARGASGLGCERRAEAGGGDFVALTEGIEDAMTIAMVRPDLRVWAAGSLAGLLAVPDHPCARGWLIFQDNDWNKPQAQKQFARAVARIRGFGKPVEVIAMPAGWGKDVNDAITRKEPS